MHPTDRPHPAHRRDAGQERQNEVATVAFNELFAATVKAGTTLPYLSLCLDEPGVPLDLGRLSAADCLNLARRLNFLLALETEIQKSPSVLLRHWREAKGS
ncbi:hypothetical protein ACIQM4_13185 [Streptomyces sp. NPDC091272]|uniref:hypothetical protein n=1 Tax=Streptomyces sp. NPDC091272 TaxID=3365981 RepID=UPI003830DBD4